MKPGCLICAFAIALLFAACGDETAPEAGASCGLAGASMACTCEDGSPGARLCGTNGLWSVCSCDGSADVGRTDAGGTDTGATDAGPADTEFGDGGEGVDVDLPDTPTTVLNACGGTGTLSLDGDEAVAPGDNCRCNGRVVCIGSNALTCIGDTTNACGGCYELPGVPNESCGPCGDGAWTCQDDGTLACEDASEPNDCGGCAPLEQRPAWQCNAGIGFGSWVCVGSDEVRCDDGITNVCGGVSTLISHPGAPCGPCGLGVLACTSDETLECSIPEGTTNACGGCTDLPGSPGEPCGECGGVWACGVGGNDLICNEERNACGGCAILDADPGEPCEGGVWVCEGESALACSADATNVCGGSADLSTSPGTTCGACGDGHVVCASPDIVACAGARSINECGGCGPLPGAVGEPCAEASVWTCTETGTLSCERAYEVNTCGGLAELDGEPGQLCAGCEIGFYLCVGENTVQCLGGQNECGGCNRLYHPETGLQAGPGDACGTCNRGVLQCDADNETLVCLGDPGADAYVDCWLDADGDGSGDPDAYEPACSCSGDLVVNADDCNDADDTVARENACGGCSVLAEELYGPCGGGCGRWECNPDGVSLVCDTSEAPTWHRDADGDGYGSDSDTRQACSAPGGYVERGGDCDDSTSAVHPGRAEIAGDAADRDEDCDGRIFCYRNSDGDGYRTEEEVESSDTDCSDFGEAHSSLPAGDCNDTNGAIYPGASEVPGDADDVSEDCDGLVACYVDYDNDGYRTSEVTADTHTSCADSRAAYASEPSGDCNDRSTAYHPGRAETCDGNNYNCNASDGDGCPSGCYGLRDPEAGEEFLFCSAQRRAFDEAQAFCAGQGMALAPLSSWQQWHAVATEMPADFYSGGRRVADEIDFTWRSGSAFWRIAFPSGGGPVGSAYTNFRTNPTFANFGVSRCVVSTPYGTSSTHGWYTNDCVTRLPFACYRNY